MAATRPPGGGFEEPRAISRAGASIPTLAANGAGAAAAAWTRERPGNRLRGSIEVADRVAPGGGSAAPVRLRQFPVPRVGGFRAPAAIAPREPLRVRLRLSMPARIEVSIDRIGRRPRSLRPVQHGGRAGPNRIAIPTWVPGRRLGPGVYRLRVRALTAERAGCPVTARLEVRP